MFINFFAIELKQHNNRDSELSLTELMRHAVNAYLTNVSQRVHYTMYVQIIFLNAFWNGKIQ